MLLVVIDGVNLFGWREPAMLTFTNWQGRDISDSNPQDANFIGILDDDSVIIYPAIDIQGVDETTDPAKIAGADLDFDVKPTGVDMDTNAWAMNTDIPVDDTAIAIDDLEQQSPTEGATAVPTDDPTTSLKKVKSPVKKVASPRMGMAAWNSWVRKDLRSMPLVWRATSMPMHLLS